MNSKERFLASIRGEPVDRVPVFPLLMFFAQRRHGITYRELSTNGTSMAEAQLRMRDSYGLDAITACTDAFRVPADLGATMVFPDDKPPFAAQPLVRSSADLEKLRRPDPCARGTRMADRVNGLRHMVRHAGSDCAVVGWVDMPFAEACSLCGVTEFMLMLVDDPHLAHSILQFLTNIVIDFSIAQLETGAPMIGAGDAAASLVSPGQYREFALPYEQRVCETVHARNGLVKLHICGNTTHLLEDMAGCGADLFNVDHLVDFDAARDAYGKRKLCFKGNLNPVVDVMQATPEQCRELCLDRLRRAKGTRFMLSAGCEIPAETSDEVFEVFCKAPQAASGKNQ